MFFCTTFLVDFFLHYAFEMQLFFRAQYFFDNALGADAQRDSGLAQQRLSLNVLRGSNVQFRTKLSAELLPRLRQTAR
jgi:hypothetical protein